MRLGSEIELAAARPSGGLPRFPRRCADGNAGVRQVRKAGKDIAQAGIEVGGGFLQRWICSRKSLVWAMAALASCPTSSACDFFGSLVALGLAGFGLGDGLPALGVDLAKVLQHGSRIHAALAQLLLDQGQVFADEIQIKHDSDQVWD
jgi:hypothetical protein